MAADTDRERCHAITATGDRCRRAAEEDGFCYQHDERDATVASYGGLAADGGDGDGDRGGDSDSHAENADEGESAETKEDDDASAAESKDGGGRDGEDGGRSDGASDLDDVRDVRETVQSLAPEIIGRELDAVIEVEAQDGGWQAVVEVVERPAVPDTQDILGRYEIDLADGAVTGYRRLDRYRRGDTAVDEVT